MSRHQFIYTSCKRGIDDNISSNIGDGQKLYSKDKNFPSEDYKIISSSMFSYEPPINSSIKLTDEIMKSFPVSFRFDVLSNGHMAVINNIYSKDYTQKRFGNIFRYCMTFDSKSDIDVYPIQLYKNEILSDIDTHSDEVPDYLPEPEKVLSEKITFEKVLEFINCYEYRKIVLKNLIYMVIHYYKFKKQIIICDEKDNIPLWIASVSCFLPKFKELNISLDMPFNTYIYNPKNDTKSIIIGVYSENTAYDYKDDAFFDKYFVMDIIHNKVKLIEESELEKCQYISEMCETVIDSMSFEMVNYFAEYMYENTYVRNLDACICDAYNIYQLDIMSYDIDYDDEIKSYCQNLIQLSGFVESYANEKLKANYIETVTSFLDEIIENSCLEKLGVAYFIGILNIIKKYDISEEKLSNFIASLLINGLISDEISNSDYEKLTEIEKDMFNEVIKEKLEIFIKTENCDNINFLKLKNLFKIIIYSCSNAYFISFLKFIKPSEIRKQIYYISMIFEFSDEMNFEQFYIIVRELYNVYSQHSDVITEIYTNKIADNFNKDDSFDIQNVYNKIFSSDIDLFIKMHKKILKQSNELNIPIKCLIRCIENNGNVADNQTALLLKDSFEIMMLKRQPDIEIAVSFIRCICYCYEKFSTDEFIFMLKKLDNILIPIKSEKIFNLFNDINTKIYRILRLKNPCNNIKLTVFLNVSECLKKELYIEENIRDYVFCGYNDKVIINKSNIIFFNGFYKQLAYDIKSTINSVKTVKNIMKVIEFDNEEIKAEFISMIIIKFASSDDMKPLITMIKYLNNYYDKDRIIADYIIKNDKLNSIDNLKNIDKFFNSLEDKEYCEYWESMRNNKKSKILNKIFNKEEN